ncbi:hypothetical protein AQUCO_01700368v1 [Aquilegia coerulea]|uniref:Uncharacterized protein n=1 Tax=Aquilegia coerulea TaxID=218851 RepID=A0A2G5DMI1_AQUCA|nr:hypothetical protein AQUCO_01700368v1 [Aquilegia coerulea]
MEYPFNQKTCSFRQGPFTIRLNRRHLIQMFRAIYFIVHRILCRGLVINIQTFMTNVQKAHKVCNCLISDGLYLGYTIT